MRVCVCVCEGECIVVGEGKSAISLSSFASLANKMYT